jgi:hypothetical protein
MFHCESEDGSKRSRASLLIMHIGFGLLLAASLALVFGMAVMLLWNAVLPDLLGAACIGYWQAVGLLVLARILVGGFGHGHAGHRARRQDADARRAYDAWWREVGEKNYSRRSGEEAAASGAGES